MGLTDPAAPYDLRFIDEMIMHHQGAIISAGMMIGDSEQAAEIAEMEGYLRDWYGDASTPDTLEGMRDMMRAMPTTEAPATPCP